MTDAPFRPFESHLDEAAALARLREATAGAEDGELFLERRRGESLVLDDGRIRNASYDASEGFGLRAVKGDVAGYAHSTEISESALKRATETARLAVGDGGGMPAAPDWEQSQLVRERYRAAINRVYQAADDANQHLGIDMVDVAAAVADVCACAFAQHELVARDALVAAEHRLAAQEGGGVGRHGNRAGIAARSTQRRLTVQALEARSKSACAAMPVRRCSSPKRAPSRTAMRGPRSALPDARQRRPCAGSRTIGPTATGSMQ